MWRQRFDREMPEKIVCVGFNYRDHATDQSAELPGEPLLFGKFPNSLVDPGEPSSFPRTLGTWTRRLSSQL